MDSSLRFSRSTAQAVVLAVTLLCIGCSQSEQKTGQSAPRLRFPDLERRGGDPAMMAELQKAQGTIERLRAAIGSHPEILKSYVEIAQVYLQESRASGKHQVYIPIASEILDTVLQRAPEDFGATLLKGSIMMTLHRFAEAKALAEKATRLFPNSSLPYGILTDAHIELGEYQEAVAACDRMLKLRPGLPAYARASYQRELHGDIEGARMAMELAVGAGMPGAEDRSWALYNLGNLYLAQGKLDTARMIFEGTLKERGNYPFALSGLAQIKAAEKDFGGAVELLVKASQVSPEHLFVEQLADLYIAMGQPDAARPFERNVLEAFAQHEKDGWNIDREFAHFCANHNLELKESLVRAEREYRRRPENIDALDTYAWVLLKNGNAVDAVPIIEKAMRLNTPNAQLNYHAGLIYKRAGRISDAISQLRYALSKDQFLPASCVDDARHQLSTISGIASNN